MSNAAVKPVFLDTSAFLKLFNENEKYFTEVRKIVAESNLIVVSYLTRDEIVGALGRKVRQGELSRDRFQETWDLAQRDLQRCIEVNLDASRNHTPRLAEAYGLKSGDNIQLASAVAAREDLQVPLSFIVFDDEPSAAARLEGFDVIDTMNITSLLGL